MNSSWFKLMVVADQSVLGQNTTAMSEFRDSVEAAGGIWFNEQGIPNAESIKNLAPGSHVFFLGNDSQPETNLFEKLAWAAANKPLAQVCYGNVQLPEGPHGLPEWSPLLIQQVNYIGDSFLIRSSWLLSLLEAGVCGEPWDLLRATQRFAGRVARIPETWLAELALAWYPLSQDRVSSLKSLAAAKGPALSRQLITLTAGAKFPSDETIPKDKHGKTFISAHLEATRTASTLEHLVLIGSECSEQALDDIKRQEHARVITTDEPFNYSSRNNLGRQNSQADVLVFVNDDFIPTQDDWLDRLLAPFADPAVGVTGCTLLYPDGSIQHASHRVESWRIEHDGLGLRPGQPRFDSLTAVDREVDGVTGACLAIRASVFDEVGGFYEGFPLSFNDLDLCLKARALGYRVVNVGKPLGIHYESQTRVAVTLPEELATFLARWPHLPQVSDHNFGLDATKDS